MAVNDFWIRISKNEPIVKIMSQTVRAVFLDFVPKRYMYFYNNCFRIELSFSLMKRALITFLM